MNTYNGKTTEQIQNNLPCNMVQCHKELYMKNVNRVIEIQTTGYNKHEIEGLKNTNFLLIQLYLFN